VLACGAFSAVVGALTPLDLFVWAMSFVLAPLLPLQTPKFGSFNI
jgi:hypothetical protein